MHDGRGLLGHESHGFRVDLKGVRFTNKSQLVRYISYDTGYSSFSVEKVLDSLTECVKKSLSSGGKVQIAGFGSFETKRRAARIGRNPHTREAVPIPARIIPVFKPSTSFNDAVTVEIENGCRKK